MTRSQTGRKVFVTNLGFHDYSSAQEHGDLIPITKGHFDLKHTDRLEALIQEVIINSDSDDLLLLSGNPLLVALAVGSWYRLHGRVKILYWDQLYQSYIMRETNFSDKNEQLEAFL